MLKRHQQFINTKNSSKTALMLLERRQHSGDFFSSLASSKFLFADTYQQFINLSICPIISVLWRSSSLTQAKPSLQLLGNSCVCSSAVPVMGCSYLYLLFILTVIMWYNWTQSLQHLKDFTQLPVLHLQLPSSQTCAVLLRLKGGLGSQLQLVLCVF